MQSQERAQGSDGGAPRGRGGRIAHPRGVENGTAGPGPTDAPHLAAAGVGKQAGTGREGALQPGAPAPDFKLHSTPDQTVELGDFVGRPVVLVFYPADWSPVCGDQLALYNEILPEFNRLSGQLLGISVDGPWCHAAYAASRQLHFPLLADFEPKGETARRYGAYRSSAGVSERALFVINGEGKIHWSFVSAMGVNPGADGILNALEELNSKGASRGHSTRSAHPEVAGVGPQGSHAGQSRRRDHTAGVR